MIAKTQIQLLRETRFLIGTFMLLLLLSGITAFPLEWELAWLSELTSGYQSGIITWINRVYSAVKETNAHYPFMAYGTDWLAFAHIVIAVAFIGPLADPVKNIWVIQFGMIACVMVLPLAFICGNIRHIPFFWQLIDCSFGVIGFIPLYLAYRNTRKIEMNYQLIY